MVSEWAAQLTSFLQAHAAWAGPVCAMLAFAESLAFVSLIVPTTVMLVGIGALLGASGLSFWAVWLGASLGAAAGDWLSFCLGHWVGPDIGRWWPLSRFPGLLARGHAFFQRWGAAGIFIGRFFGPLRASVPLAAGICGMPALSFQLANVTSAFVWAFVLLAPGLFGAKWLSAWLH